MPPTQPDLFGSIIGTMAEPERHARRYDPDTSRETARRLQYRSQGLRVLRGYGSGRELLDHDAYRLAGFPVGRGTHQRCSDLRRWGWIAWTGRRAMTPSGHSGKTSIITSAGMRVLLEEEGPRVE